MIGIDAKTVNDFTLQFIFLFSQWHGILVDLDLWLVRCEFSIMRV